MPWIISEENERKNILKALEEVDQHDGNTPKLPEETGSHMHLGVCLHCGGLFDGPGGGGGGGHPGGLRTMLLGRQNAAGATSGVASSLVSDRVTGAKQPLKLVTGLLALK
jgi:hypothetical protein